MLTALWNLITGNDNYGSANTVGAARSSHWSKVRKAHLELEKDCQVCGSVENLQVHHIKPFHLFPDLELEQSNLITLCEGKSRNCHLLFGHLLNWHSYNVSVRDDAKQWNQKIKNRPSDM